ncbi:nucleoside diphosphate kinase regulator [Vibrio diabolicus]|jgi:regulator of nucleoside diphosphate kinase|uniref:Nucleoside diphosphate kinase regulator n=3 Tax=Vibrio TaxID=662 RepID=A0A0T7E134_9VIBR|nr:MULTISPECIES: nucleoside diphosphate kinase regulator [Vibrio]KOY45006.1 nucleoside diphosphate kinase regulator [Vibrio parahaemolyticus]MDW2256955.1 nucleoside diphosphate kinase regulator [Vibrio sp. 1409]MEA3482610.1 nucleoside diphosphate kinase regulator [Pseudomonadota bacterium]ACY52755.1 regulator of nucleoside diphosphate kinase [Vibrio antiquarius]ALR94101.1 nucleoside diphosphate kinase regulator [Vibrio alginolyticus]|eukprot:NODE_1004_length_1947_cov_2.322917_g953_i0.p2 GENE.NODE_1004_length_1947_cov_2.322917_g953_i0~~NODE_1004_length_1947_cov_2.322917_g953_i0.p2  ORF type:complete len:136 (-),score=1.44 NODE_1004_length_1947_cov_2.322917_g953_i0:1114-1521(-)
MSENNSIYISSLDMNRITALLDKMPNIAAELVELEAELDRATVLEPEQMPDNVVTMNSTVEFKFAGEDRTMTKTLVYPSELKSSDDISIFAPVGSALIGLSVGQKLEWPMPNNQVKTIEIVDITYQPERCGALNR